MKLDKKLRIYQIAVVTIFELIQKSIQKQSTKLASFVLPLLLLLLLLLVAVVVMMAIVVVMVMLLLRVIPFISNLILFDAGVLFPPLLPQPACEPFPHQDVVAISKIDFICPEIYSISTFFYDALYSVGLFSRMMIYRLIKIKLTRAWALPSTVFCCWGIMFVITEPVGQSKDDSFVEPVEQIREHPVQRLQAVELFGCV